MNPLSLPLGLLLALMGVFPPLSEGALEPLGSPPNAWCAQLLAAESDVSGAHLALRHLLAPEQDDENVERWLAEFSSRAEFKKARKALPKIDRGKLAVELITRNYTSNRILQMFVDTITESEVIELLVVPAFPPQLTARGKLVAKNLSHLRVEIDRDPSLALSRAEEYLDPEIDHIDDLLTDPFGHIFRIIASGSGDLTIKKALDFFLSSMERVKEQLVSLKYPAQTFEKAMITGKGADASFVIPVLTKLLPVRFSGQDLRSLSFPLKRKSLAVDEITKLSVWLYGSRNDSHFYLSVRLQDKSKVAVPLTFDLLDTEGRVFITFSTNQSGYSPHFDLTELGVSDDSTELILRLHRKG